MWLSGPLRLSGYCGGRCWRLVAVAGGRGTPKGRGGDGGRKSAGRTGNGTPKRRPCLWEGAREPERSPRSAGSGVDGLRPRGSSRTGRTHGPVVTGRQPRTSRGGQKPPAGRRRREPGWRPAGESSRRAPRTPAADRPTAAIIPDRASVSLNRAATERTAVASTSPRSRRDRAVPRGRRPARAPPCSAGRRERCRAPFPAERQPATGPRAARPPASATGPAVPARRPPATGPAVQAGRQQPMQSAVPRGRLALALPPVPAPGPSAGTGRGARSERPAGGDASSERETRSRPAEGRDRRGLPAAHAGPGMRLPAAYRHRPAERSGDRCARPAAGLRTAARQPTGLVPSAARGGTHRAPAAAVRGPRIPGPDGDGAASAPEPCAEERAPPPGHDHRPAARSRCAGPAEQPAERPGRHGGPLPGRRGNGRGPRAGLRVCAGRTAPRRPRRGGQGGIRDRRVPGRAMG